MSSFLCFICHSTVNADTNEDMREKYREVVGMHLCPDSHLCHICCHVLNKLSLFRAVCLKRSLEYPVLFSEKGTLNLQRNDLEFLTLCPEESCGQYYNRNINSKTFNFNFSNYQNDSDNFNDYNQYHQNELISNVNDYFNYEEQMFDTNFNLQLQSLQQNNEIQSFPECVDNYSNTSTDYTQNNESETDFERDIDVRRDIDIRKEVSDLDIRKEEYTQMYSCREDELKQFVLYKNSYNCYEKPYENHNYETHINNQIDQHVNINNLPLNNVNLYENQNVECVNQKYLLNHIEKPEISNQITHKFSTHQLTTLQCRNTNSCMEWEGNTFKNYNISKTIINERINTNLIANEQNIDQSVTNIVQNIPNIGQNVSNIGQHLPNISQNVTNVGQNVTNIGQKVTNIGENVENIGQNVTNISQNVVNIGQNFTSNLEESLYPDSDYCLTELVQTNKTIKQEGINVPLFNDTEENQEKTENEFTKLHEILSSDLEKEENVLDAINTTTTQDTNVTSFTNAKEQFDESLMNLQENKTDDQKMFEESIENQSVDDEVIEDRNDGNESIENSISSPIPSETEEQTNTQSEIYKNCIKTKVKSKKKKNSNEKEKKKKVTEEKGFIKIVLTVEEQKAELEANRKDKKYLNAEYKCYNCALGFLFKDTYQAHMMRHEESNGEYKCSLCSLRFASIRVLRAHRAGHVQRHECLTCARVVRGTRRSAHARICHRKEMIACHLCGKVFRDTSCLQQHLKRLHKVTTNRNMKCVCNVCGETFTENQTLRTHMINHLTKKFTCSHCPATFSRPYRLNQHTKRHTNPNSELHYCMTCGISYNSRKSLLAHQRNALAHQENIQECPLCTRVCPNQKALTTHIETVHSHTETYACTVCPRRYTNKTSLVRHMGTHSGSKQAKNAVCHLCGKVFKGTSKLNRHLRQVCEKTKLEEELAALYMNAG